MVNGALGIGSSQKFDGLQEVSQDLLEAFKVIVGRFTSDGQKFGRPVLEESGNLLDCGHLGFKHVGKLITYDEYHHGTV